MKYARLILVVLATTMLFFIGCGGKNSVVMPWPPFVGFLNEKDIEVQKNLYVTKPGESFRVAIRVVSYKNTRKSRDMAKELAAKLSKYLTEDGWESWLENLGTADTKCSEVYIGELGKRKVALVVFKGWASRDSVAYRGWLDVSDFETEEGLAEIAALIYRAKDAN